MPCSTAGKISRIAWSWRAAISSRASLIASQRSLSPSSNKRRIISPPGDPPGSRVLRTGIPARSSAAANKPIWVACPHPSPPSTAMNRPRLAVTSVPIAPPQIAGEGGDTPQRVHPVDSGGGDQRRFGRGHVRRRDDHLADGLALGDGCCDRAVV